MPRLRKAASPFGYFNSSPEVIRLVVIMYVRFLLSLRNVEDPLFERRIDVSHETVRLWWNRFGPLLRARSVGRGFRACAGLAIVAACCSLCDDGKSVRLESRESAVTCWSEGNRTR